MILVSVLLVAAAFGLLIAGSSFFLAEILLVYASIGVSLIAALLLGVGAFRRRSELMGGAASGSPAEASPGSASAAPATGPAKSSAKGSASSATVAGGGAAATTATAATKNPPKTRKAAPASVSADIPGDAQVFAVPARRTYHTENCRQLRTREHHELGYAEAREQGYTACTSCMPDSVLAARGGSASTGAE